MKEVSNMRRPFLVIALAIGASLGVSTFSQRAAVGAAQKAVAGVPTFQVDTTWQWPPKLPNNWVVGIVSFVTVDRHDHVWIMQRYRQLDPKLSDHAAPPVLEFDENRQFVQAWGGPGQGYDWPDTEHGLTVDYQDNVWITGMSPLEPAFKNPSTRTDDMILKFTNKGKFIKQFGGRDRHPALLGGNDDKTSVHLATDTAVYPKTNELFVSDGYANRRVVVLDAETLAFKRMWGAFGLQPPPQLGRAPNGGGWPGSEGGMLQWHDPQGPKVFNSVHGVKVSNDGIVYVGDRNYRRIQSFTTDGKYLSQAFVNAVDPGERAGTPRPEYARPYFVVCAMAFSHDPEQKYIYVGDYGNGHIHIVDRKTLKTVSSFGKQGTKPGEFGGIHAVSADSKGNLWVAETQPRPTGSRVQRFIFKGLS
jgi:DNA-binding beta-propeller fold protein YncE